MQEANWVLYKKQKEAEAILNSKMKEAEGKKATAEAEFYARKLAADGDLYAKQKEAEGLEALGKSQGAYLKSISTALGGDNRAVKDFLMIDRGVYQEMGRINAEAVRGLQPKLSIWNTTNESGCGAGGGDASSSAVREVSGIYRALPPLFQTIYDQTGMTPPPYMGVLPQTQTAMTPPQILGTLALQSSDVVPNNNNNN